MFWGVLLGSLVYWLGLVFSGDLILNPVFNLGGLKFRFYGLFLALGVGMGLWVTRAEMTKKGVSEEDFERAAVMVILTAFISARIYHVISDLSFYVENPVKILEIWKGGLSIIGAILGGLLSIVWIYIKSFKKYSFSFLTLLDMSVFGLLLGQIVGRFGNLFNYEAYGWPTLLPWKMFVPEIYRLPNMTANYYHPVFLYEALGNVFILWFIWRLEKRRKTIAGRKVFSYLIMYGVLRFGLEYLRMDSTIMNGLRINAFISAVAVFAGLAGFVYLSMVHEYDNSKR